MRPPLRLLGYLLIVVGVVLGVLVAAQVAASGIEVGVGITCIGIGAMMLSIGRSERDRETND